MALSDKLLSLSKQLYPNGRAFKMPKDGYLESLHIALGLSEASAYNDAVAIHNSILPDNSNFTADDATDWERRLGLITNEATPLADRKAAIQRKMNYPSGNPAKQHYLYLQTQLQAANFNVYVYENRFPDYPDGYFTQSPLEITGDTSLITSIEHGELEHGEFEHGGYYNNKVANHIDESKDLTFDIGDNFRSTFFIGGSPLGTDANVPLVRKDEFRQLILRLKPVQTVAFLFINYT